MSRLSENRTARESSNSGSSSAEFSSDERRVLLGAAHDSILSAFAGRAPEAPVPPHLSDPRGVFTTLYLDGNLRGCVGYALPVAPLYRAVCETARAAAFEDSRFLPVTEQEAPRLEICLSVLSRLFPIQAEQVEIGRHGLIICLGGRRGLLLPQVPVEYDWDRQTFIEQTCRKAGLPFDAWRQGATLEAFTAEVFGDADLSS
jgi:AmmeMemoRadiSam system protein A